MSGSGAYPLRFWILSTSKQVLHLLLLFGRVLGHGAAVQGLVQREQRVRRSLLRRAELGLRAALRTPATRAIWSLVKAGETVRVSGTFCTKMGVFTLHT